MTLDANGQHLPNHIRYHHDTTRFSDHFGQLHSITPVCLTGGGHTPHIEIRSTYGLRLDVTAEWLTALVRQAPAALAKFPHYLPDVSGAAAELGGGL